MIESELENLRESCPFGTALIHQAGRLMGKCPSWPETLGSARVRYAKRFLDHLRRARHIKKSCLLVTHGHMVQVWKDVEEMWKSGRMWK